jgi:4-diphosphocytidyl-2-C-methyl-D-erythritol kinase
MKRHLLIEAAAKINLSLDVVGKRQDGYHLLESVMQSITLRDQLEINWDSEGNGIIILSDQDDMPLDDSNTCAKAARLWQQKTGMSGLLTISIKKRIPMQAGLGGGSADAAAVLYSLNLIYGGLLDQSEMYSLAAQTGADVPFCLQGGIGFCQGIGEIITDLTPMPVRPVLLIKPDFGLSTPEVFRRLNWQESCIGSDHKRIIEAVRQGSWEQLGETAFNALQRPACEIRPEINNYLDLLRQTPAQMVMMTGSGTCVYAVYDNPEDLKSAQDIISNERTNEHPGLNWIEAAETCDKGLGILEMD